MRKYRQANASLQSKAEARHWWDPVVGAIFWTLCLVCLPVFAFGQSAKNPHYPVLVVDEDAGVIAIVDEINFRLPLAFEQVLDKVPNANTLLLHSPGGDVYAALVVASRVRELGMTTRIDRASKCYSACSIIFFAGTFRQVDGELGVHQITSETGDMVSGQFALADIFEMLIAFNIPAEIISKMMRTPPEEMHVFSAEEIERYALQGSASGRNTSLSIPSRAREQSQSESPTPEVDYLDPRTWRGMTITGELISTGKLWYSELRPDGSTTFMSTSGKLMEGQYRIRGRSVCFLYRGSSEEACRTPVSANGRIRWKDDRGDVSSYIVNVEPRAFPTGTDSSTKARAEVFDAIGPGQCAVIVAATRTVEEAKEYVAANINDRRFVQGYLSESGWIAISIGTIAFDEKDSVMHDLRTSQRIPADSYCSQGRTLQALVDIR